MRYLDDLSPIDRYLELRAERAQINAELEELKPLITAALMDEPEQAYEYAGFRFELGRRRTYQYSDAVEVLKQELHALKKKEEQTGVAVLKQHISFPVVREIGTS